MVLFLLFKLMSLTNAQSAAVDLGQIYSPQISGSTLVIKGRIDSHIYDFLAFAGKTLKKIEWVSLNSYGGNHDWAMAIAEKLRTLNIRTRIDEGNVCASSCVYLFMSGSERRMHTTAWLGIHGARVGANYRIEFYQKCAVATTASSDFSQECQDIFTAWYETSFQATQKAFLWMQAQGASPKLFDIYMNFDDVDEWLDEGNVLRKPDWVVPATDALALSLATDLI